MNGKLCTAIKTRGEDIKSYTPVPGDRMQEGSNGRRQFNQNHVFFSKDQGMVQTGQRCLIMYLELEYKNVQRRERCGI